MVARSVGALATRDLRPGSTGRSELRVLFALAPERWAIMLIAGDKAGNWTQWYKKDIPVPTICSMITFAG